MTYERIDENGILRNDRSRCIGLGSVRKGICISVQTDGTWL